MLQTQVNSSRIYTYFCQTVTSEGLQCSLKTKRTEVAAGFKSVAANLPEFTEIFTITQS